MHLVYIVIYVGCGPLTVTVTTRIVTFLVGNPYKPSLATVTGWGVDPSYICTNYRFLKTKSEKKHHHGPFPASFARPGPEVGSHTSGVGGWTTLFSTTETQPRKNEKKGMII